MNYKDFEQVIECLKNKGYTKKELSQMSINDILKLYLKEETK